MGLEENESQKGATNGSGIQQAWNLGRSAGYPSSSRAFAAGAVSGTAECTFAPAINPDSVRLLEDATNRPAGQPGFARRQAAWEAARRAKMHRMAAEKVQLCEMDNVTAFSFPCFRPHWLHNAEAACLTRNKPPTQVVSLKEVDPQTNAEHAHKGLIDWRSVSGLMFASRNQKTSLRI